MKRAEIKARGRLIEEALTVGSELRVGITAGLPQGATLAGAFFNVRDHTLSLYFDHPSFPDKTLPTQLECQVRTL